MKNKDKYKVIGLMSGTSLDGLDIAYCEFLLRNGQWEFEIKETDTRSYPVELYEQLKNGTDLSGFEISYLDVQLGRWIGEQVKIFIQNGDLEVDFIASHGHTIFHQPELGLTKQIGDGNTIAAINHLPVIYDFRALDVALGGQGAPLVPIGDALLFSEYNYCLNLGGIANVSYDNGGTRVAYDISPCNMALNYIARKTGYDFDKGGSIARSGKIITSLLEALDNLDFYSKPYPKSLGYEWVWENVLQKIDNTNHPVENLMRTLVEHIVNQLERAIKRPSNDGKKLLVTGGGAFNTFLIEQLKQRLAPEVQVCIPGDVVINYKEALIFGFLGVLRASKQVNCLASVTGASIDNCGGSIVGEPAKSDAKPLLCNKYL